MSDVNNTSVDPLGPTDFFLDLDSNVKFFKNVSDSQVDYVERILNRNSIREAVKKKYLVDHRLEKIDGTNKLISDSILFKPISGNEVKFLLTDFHPSTLPLKLILDAGNLWVKLNKMLLKDGLCLVDAHMYNFAFDSNLNPVWIDMGSIQQISHGLEGINESRAIFEYGLKAVKRNPGIANVLRELLNQNGMQRDNWRKQSRLPIISFKNHGVISGFIRIINREFFTETSMPEFVSKFLRYVSLFWVKINLPKNSKAKGYWATYSNRKLSFYPENDRETIIKEVIDSLDWISCLDLAGSDGKFLLLATQPNKHLHLIDNEETGLNKFIEFVQSTRSQKPTNSIYFAEKNEVIKSTGNFDLVLALAITHHLALSQHWTFDGISKKMAELSDKHLIIEFMPNGVGKYQMSFKELPSWYSELNFVSALSKNFKHVRKICELENGNRILFLASKI